MRPPTKPEIGSVRFYTGNCIYRAHGSDITLVTLIDFRTQLLAFSAVIVCICVLSLHSFAKKIKILFQQQRGERMPRKYNRLFDLKKPTNFRAL